MTYGHAALLLIQKDWLTEAWAEIHADLTTQPQKESPKPMSNKTTPVKSPVEQQAVDNTDYSRFRVLTKHDAMCIEIGDFIENPATGALLRVTDFKKKKERFGISRKITLSNGYIFDPTPGADRPSRWDNITIYRPLRKFMPAGTALVS